ncbi:hypothetical protein ASG24_01260 [Methylophilus sp. Leaf414]|nr:hypothetical protein ASG24_01260 [Methylophilus sp. Leaf414]
MSELLPCPLCGHLHPEPNHGSKFKCKGCTHWIELSKDKTQLRDHTARKAAEQAKSTDWWLQQALIRQRKLGPGTDYDTAMDSVRGDHNKNVQKMKDERRGHELFPPEFPTSSPETPTPQTIVSRVISTDDTTEAPW